MTFALNELWVLANITLSFQCSMVLLLVLLLVGAGGNCDGWRSIANICFSSPGRIIWGFLLDCCCSNGIGVGLNVDVLLLRKRTRCFVVVL
jgi:hypothetical protein